MTAEAWNAGVAQDLPENRLERQEIVLTVPASFDAVARELTVEAARAAGLENVILLEEPQSAFYSWIEASDDAWSFAAEIFEFSESIVCAPATPPEAATPGAAVASTQADHATARRMARGVVAVRGGIRSVKERPAHALARRDGRRRARS